MRKQLILPLPADGLNETNELCWVLRDDECPAGNLFHGVLAEAVKQAAGARVVVLVPGEDVLLASAELPGLNRQRLARAVPFALEEQLASDVEDMHFALGSRSDDGRIHNAVVARGKIAAWLESLRAAGLQADVMLSEVLAVPREAANDAGRHWSLLIDGLRCLLRTDSQHGLALDLNNLPVILQAALDEAGDSLPASLDVKICGDDTFSGSDDDRQLIRVCEEAGIDVVLQPQEEDGALLLARGFDEKEAINLLQGDYSRRGQLEKLLRPWRPAILLLGLWLVVLLGAMGLEYSRLSQQDAEIREQITALYREAFPEARKVVDPRVQMERGLAKLRGSGGGQTDLLGFIGKAGPVLKATPGLKLRSLRYKENRLDIDLEINSLQTLDKLKQRLADEAGLTVEIVSASSRDGKVESRIALHGGGGV
ncbi:MAG: type II secretion system protein GspL [Gammaproteobacteria bacterium]|nr:type II secretion system protein GspL [Gammaproteobacteria bacterium]MCF6364223.1 type II secretion system protein GspL [Gammaproteobacteria bacterium]